MDKIFLRSQQTLKHNDKGAVLLVSLVLIVFLSVLLGAAMLRSNLQIQEVVQRRDIHEAFYAAEAGIERAVYELRQNSQWSPGQGGQDTIDQVPLTFSYDGKNVNIGFYTVLVEDGGIYQGWSTRWVTSSGFNSTKGIHRTIKARVLVENPARFLISTLGPLRIESGAVLNADVLAQDINFAVLESLPSPQKDIHVDGQVYYIHDIKNQNNPAVIYGSNSAVQKSPSITFAGVDLARYRALAQNLQSKDLSYIEPNGGLTINLSNLQSLQSQNSDRTFQPQIIYVNGDVHISGTYDHSLAIVASGNIYIDGSIVADNNSSSYKPQIGLFSKGDVLIPENTQLQDNNLNIEAFVIADGSTTGSSGAFMAQGPKSSKGSINFTGAISVRGSKGQTGVDLNVFTNRNYNFNPDLNTRRTIPFAPFIVNVINWQEI